MARTVSGRASDPSLARLVIDLAESLGQEVDPAYREIAASWPAGKVGELEPKSALNDESDPHNHGDDQRGNKDWQIGWRGPIACAAAGITYPELDRWARIGIIVPSLRSATGSGSQRIYSLLDILMLKVVRVLLGTGVSLENIRPAIDGMRERRIEDLARITLVSDGQGVFTVSAPEEISQEEILTVFGTDKETVGIALSVMLQELTESLASLPQERADGSETEGADTLLSRENRSRVADAG